MEKSVLKLRAVKRIQRLIIFGAMLGSLVCGLSQGARAGDMVDRIKSRFNRDIGKPRLIVLVSPTCPACAGGAQYIEQEILEKFPKLDLQVYAVWYEMLPGDSKAAFPAAKKMMPDARVAHYWDKKKAAGRWFKTNVPSAFNKPIQWDVYYLYDSDARWEQTPGPLVSTGRTLLETRKELLRQVSLLDEKRNGASLQ
jgi:hypothetical protein